MNLLTRTKSPTRIVVSIDPVGILVFWIMNVIIKKAAIKANTKDSTKSFAFSFGVLGLFGSSGGFIPKIFFNTELNDKIFSCNKLNEFQFKCFLIFLIYFLKCRLQFWDLLSPLIVSLPAQQKNQKLYPFHPGMIVPVLYNRQVCCL